MHCTSCGAAVPPAVLSAPFCAFCGGRRSDVADTGAAPAASAQPAAGGAVFAWPGAAASPQGEPQVVLGSNVVIGPNVVIGARKRSEPRDFPLTGDTSDIAMTFDPQVGYLLVGVHAVRGGSASLRAYDLMKGAVMWDALAGTTGLENVGWEQLGVRTRNVFVGFDRTLRALDIATGQVRWGAEFPDQIAYQSGSHGERGLSVFDPTPVGQRGAALAVCNDYTVAGFDRDSGQQLWRETREEDPGEVTVLGEMGLLYLRRNHLLVNPAYAKPVLQISGRVERFDAYGKVAVLQVENYGWLDREGVVIRDLTTNKDLLFEAVDSIEDDVPSVLGHGRVFVALENGAKLFAAPHGKAVELMPAHRIRWMTMCGPTLFVLLEKTHGTSYRRVLGVDPQTLAIRFDLGELTTEPDGDWHEQMQTDGRTLVLATSPTGNEDDCQLWGVDPGGRVLWKQAIGPWRGHAFLGGNIVARARIRRDAGFYEYLDEEELAKPRPPGGFQILRPDNGQLLASYDR